MLLFFHTILLGLVTPCLAQQSLTLEDTQNHYAFALQLEYLEDKNSKLKFKDVSQASSSVEWQQNYRSEPNYGNTDSAYWFRIILNKPEASTNQWLLEINNIYINHIELHVVNPDQQLVQRNITGDRHPFKQRPKQHRHFIFPLDLAAGDNHLYLRVKSDSIRLPLALREARSFDDKNNSEMLVMGLVFL